jgi:hypothetical protein
VSVVEEFHDVEQRIVCRLAELAPVIEEYHQLQALALRLGIDPLTGDPLDAVAHDAQERRPSRPTLSVAHGIVEGFVTAPPRAVPPVPPGTRAHQLLTLVRERPGITVSEAGKVLGVDPTGLYRVVRRLERDGELRKHGRTLEPVNGQG